MSDYKMIMIAFAICMLVAGVYAFLNMKIGGPENTSPIPTVALSQEEEAQLRQQGGERLRALQERRAQAERAEKPRIYERYSDNFVPEPTWPESADDMQLIEPDDRNVRPFFIDRYEATISQRRAWSVEGLTPTTKLKYQDAVDACHAAGKRLCREREWRIACRGGSTRPMGFNRPDLLMDVCDFARSKGYDANDYVNKNNSHPACVVSTVNLHHMMGNVTEFVEGPQRKTLVVGLAYYDQHIRDKARYMRESCEITVHGPGKYPLTKHNEGLGFRCCRDAR